MASASTLLSATIGCGIVLLKGMLQIRPDHPTCVGSRPPTKRAKHSDGCQPLISSLHRTTPTLLNVSEEFQNEFRRYVVNG